MRSAVHGSPFGKSSTSSSLSDLGVEDLRLRPEGLRLMLSKVEVSQLIVHRVRKSVNRELKTVNKPGQILIVALIFFTVILILSASLFGTVGHFLKFSSNSILREQAVHLAEAGVDYAIWQLNETAGSYIGPENDTAVGTTGTFSLSITTKSPALKTITSTGYVPNATNPKAKRTIKVDVLISSESISFRYAVQTGTGGVSMANSSTINGNVYSNGNISGSGSSTINGDAWAVGTISTPDPVITGQKKENQQPAKMPIDDPQSWYQERKLEAEAGGTTTCSPTCSISGGFADLVTQKYIGNLIVTNNAIVTVKSGPIYVTGDLTVSQGGTKVNLDESFGSNGTILIVDGTISISQGATFNTTSANPKGYILVITTSTSDTAISISNQGVNAIMYTLDGGTQLSQSAQAKALIAKTLTMTQSATLDYESGFASSQFSSGPGASWVIKKGTYRFTGSP